MHKTLIDSADGLSDEEIDDLEEYFPNAGASQDYWRLSIYKLKVLLHLIRRDNVIDNDGVEKIISFVYQYVYGWHNDRYKFDNHCFRHSQDHCRQVSRMSYQEQAEDTFFSIQNIFFNEDYGEITLYIFSYCLAALFTSKLGSGNLRIPFFLQIACERNTALYDLIQTIIMICDVNYGLINECRDHYRQYGSCGYQCITYYPTQYVERDINHLACNRDIPVIIDGHENEKYYHAILREVANMPNKKQPLGLKDRFNILPIFICPSIKSSFNNVINMNLAEVLVSKEYLNLVEKNKQQLASWVLELIKEFNTYLLPNEDNPDKKDSIKIKYPFAYEIRRHVNLIRTKYTNLSSEDAMNVGLLSFFFKGYMEVFKRMVTVPHEEAYFYTENKEEKMEIEKVIDYNLIVWSEKTLARIHEKYSQIPLESILTNTISPGSKEAQQRNAEAIKVARKILRYYSRYKVLIRIKKIEVKDDRFIYDIQLVPGTEYEHIFKRAGNIQLLLNYEYFIPIKEGASIKIVAAEKLIYENSLTKILNDEIFQNAKMKIPYAIGTDEKGDAKVVDIADFPHLLIAGVSGAGKSSALECLLTSIVYKHHKGNDVKVLVFDLGKSSLYLFDKIPILLSPIIKDTRAGYMAILKLKDEMEKRYEIIHSNRNSLNQLPSIVCIVDEFPFLFNDITNKNENKKLNDAISGLIKRGRSAKIFMIFTTQDPQKEYMKFGRVSNVASKMALRCSDVYESKAIIGKRGADKLIGKGSMIVNFPNNGMIYKNIQGAYIPENDIKKLLAEIKFDPKKEYEFEMMDSKTGQLQSEVEEMIEEKEPMSVDDVDVDDVLLAEAIFWTLSQNTVSNNKIKKFGRSFDNANIIMEKLEHFDLITKKDIMKPMTPRKANNKSIEEIMKIPELMDILTRNGLSENDIAEAINRRLENKPLSIDEVKLRVTSRYTKKEIL
jgi:S-DNA-T family DNA segregation ATPase FtsK/SpoIIIE